MLHFSGTMNVSDIRVAIIIRGSLKNAGKAVKKLQACMGTLPRQAPNLITATGLL
jgi:hypothetical protein